MMDSEYNGSSAKSVLAGGRYRTRNVLQVLPFLVASCDVLLQVFGLAFVI